MVKNCMSIMGIHMVTSGVHIFRGSIQSPTAYKILAGISVLRMTVSLLELEMKVKEIHPKKQVKFELKNCKSKYAINTGPTDQNYQPCLCSVDPEGVEKLMLVWPCVVISKRNITSQGRS